LMDFLSKEIQCQPSLVGMREALPLIIAAISFVNPERGYVRICVKVISSNLVKDI
jgi:hypothetical protein